jgi:hypothetical protein
VTLIPSLGALGYWLGLWTLVFFAIGTWCCRRELWNPIDPLLVLMLNVALNVAVVTVLGIRLDTSGVAFVVLGFGLFIFGLTRGRSRHQGNCESDPSALGPSPVITRLTLVVIAITYLTYDSFVIRQIGFGVFGGANPDLAKIVLTQGGNGLFRYILVGANLFFLPLLLHALFVYRLRWTFGIGLIFYIVQNMVFGFSKAGFVFDFVNVGILAFYYRRALGRHVIPMKFVAYVVLLGGVPAVIVLGVLAAKYGLSISSIVVQRLVATASGSYMYFNLGGAHAFDGFNTAARWGLYFDNLLSPLRLKAWASSSYAAQVGEYLTGTSLPGFGANPYMFVSGDFLFGWWGLVYCYACGRLINFARHRRVGVLTFYVGVQLAFYVPADPGIAQTVIIALIGFTPIWIVLRLIALAQARELSWPIRPTDAVAGSSA